MEHKEIDIVIPIYNVAPYLRRCLDSIKSQTYPHWRAICVNDGSTDECPKVLEEYAAADSRFVVIHKENGGLSDARNAGVRAANAEYLMFVDSDDFIHPQTLEIALHLALRDDSDVVCWYRDPIYRNVQLRLLKLLGRDTINAVPWGMRHRYNPHKIKGFKTDHLLAYISDWNHPRQRRAVKHCYVWRHLFRRSTMEGLDFIKGLNYEDIPWWSEFVLKPLKATITRLPLYYYYLNYNSIAKSTKTEHKLYQILRGLGHAYHVYLEHADSQQMYEWSHNIKWAVISGFVKYLNRTPLEEFSQETLLRIAKLAREGFFDDAQGDVEKLIQHAYLSKVETSAISPSSSI